MPGLGEFPTPGMLRELGRGAVSQSSAQTKGPKSGGQTFKWRSNGSAACRAGAGCSEGKSSSWGLLVAPCLCVCAEEALPGNGQPFPGLLLSPLLPVPPSPPWGPTPAVCQQLLVKSCTISWNSRSCPLPPAPLPRAGLCQLQLATGGGQRGGRIRGRVWGHPGPCRLGCVGLEGGGGVPEGGDWGWLVWFSLVLLFLLWCTLQSGTLGWQGEACWERWVSVYMHICIYLYNREHLLLAAVCLGFSLRW